MPSSSVVVSKTVGTRSDDSSASTEARRRAVACVARASRSSIASRRKSLSKSMVGPFPFGLIGVSPRLPRRALYVGPFLLYAKRSTSRKRYFFVANQLFRGVENGPWLSGVGRIQRPCD